MMIFKVESYEYLLNIQDDDNYVSNVLYDLKIVNMYRLLNVQVVLDALIILDEDLMIFLNRQQHYEHQLCMHC